jgi:hypothetical protein
MKEKLTNAAAASLILVLALGLSACTTMGGHEMMDDSSQAKRMDTMQTDTMQKDTMNNKMMEKDQMESGMSDTMK